MLADWQLHTNSESGAVWKLDDVKTVFVDGIKIKEGTWYRNVNGEIVEEQERDTEFVF